MASKLKKSMIEAAMSRDETCAYEISVAEKELARIRGMSDEGLTSEAQKHYDESKSFYRNRITEIHINGEVYYDGEQEEMISEYQGLKLLSASEWKDTILTNLQNRMDSFQKELDEINELKSNNVINIGSHPQYH